MWAKGKNMTKTAVLTIVSNNYMPYAATLLQSVRDTNPDYRRYIFLADRIDQQASLWPDLAEIVEARELGIPDFDDMSLRYDIMEFNTAIKPFALKWLLENTDADHVIYLDPDICVYRRLERLDSILNEGCSVVLTPHITRPLEDDYLPDDHSMLKAGVFNLGFIAVSRTTDAMRYLDWWSRRLKTQCYSDTTNNLFTDQRWCDLAPCFVDNLYILKDPTYNVAYWNMPHRFPTHGSSSENLLIEGAPLSFFHFSGLRLDKSEFVSKHQNRFQWDDIKPFKTLFIEYRNKLLSNKWTNLSTIKYNYDYVGNLYVPPVIRRLYRDVFADVYQELPLNENFIISLCNACCNNHDVNSEYRITRLMDRVYRERPDLQATFDLKTAGGTQAYVGWFEQSAVQEYKLDPRVVFQASIASNQKIPEFMPLMPIPNADRGFFFRRWRKIRKAMLNRLEKL